MVSRAILPAILTTLVTAFPLPSQSYVSIGEGCPGSTGIPQLEAAPGSEPRIAETFSAQLTNVPDIGFAVGITGLLNTSWGLVQLPADLTLIGMPGCLLHTDIRRQEAVAINNGVASWDLAVPTGPEWLGRSFYQQALVLDQTVAGLGAVMSNAMQGTIGVSSFQSVDETFDDEAMLDKDRSTGSWGGGSGVFGLQGGDGRHGTFAYSDGVPMDVNKTVWEWCTDSQIIVSDEDLSNNWMNQDLQVNDGIFQFTDFNLPEEITLIFKGSNPVRIFVRGRCEILGKIIANGVDLSDLWNGKKFDDNGVPTPPLPQPGQLGSLGGPGGGGGGQGADTWGVGSPGTDVVLLPGNIYGGPSGRQILTGGRGGPLVPAHGDPTLVNFTTPYPPIFPVPQDTFSQYIAGGGGGGGFWTPGQKGLAIQDGYKTELFAPISPVVPNPTYFAASGPDVTPGDLFDFLPKPTTTSSDHYVIGGSGGGGGGSHALLAKKTQAGVIEEVLFSSGAGGAGGGGAIAFRAGKSLVMGGTSLIECRGGSAGDQTRSPTTFGARAPWPNGIASPGGGGSGGSILFMVDGSADMQGSLDVSPGTGGVARRELPPSGTTASKFVYHTRGGDGASGYIRLETEMVNPTIGIIGNHIPPGIGHVGTTREEWPQVAFQSLWYATNQVFPPIYRRYEVEAEVDGATVIYSDNPAVGVLAQHGTTPLSFLVQGADVIPGTGQVLDPSQVKGWRDYVGRNLNPVPQGSSLDGDGRNGFRWLLLLDRSFGADVVIKRVSIVLEQS